MVRNSVGFGRRLLATILDGLLFSFITFLLGFIWASEFGLDLLEEVYLFVLPLLWYGYTVGKRAVSIRIVRMDGKALSFWTMFKRNVISGLAYASPILVAFLLAAILDPSFFLGNWSVTKGPISFSIVGLPFDWEAFTTFTTNLLLIGFLATLVVILVSVGLVVFRSDHRSLHDFIAGTYVTSTPPEAKLSQKAETEETSKNEM